MNASSCEAVVFDALGTLFDLTPLREAFAATGAPPSAFDVWLARTLHHGTALTSFESFAPFKELAAGTLAWTLAEHGVEPTEAPLAALGELQPYSDAEDALAHVREGGCAVVVLTNGGAEDTAALLERGGIAPYVDHVVSVDAAEAFKPHPAPYAIALHLLQRRAERIAYISAHAWDCAGASAQGMRALWVDRAALPWPLPQAEPERFDTLLAAAQAV